MTSESTSIPSGLLEVKRKSKCKGEGRGKVRGKVSGLASQPPLPNLHLILGPDLNGR